LIQPSFTPTTSITGSCSCVNHAMLTAQAIQHAGLTLAGWVANDVTPPGKRHAEYMTTLTRMIPAPLPRETPCQNGRAP
ncbi:ATP-dependent dethiobiotin synthetase BioD, partial [Escherichia sp. TWPC-MK]